MSYISIVEKDIAAKISEELRILFSPSMSINIVLTNYNKNFLLTKSWFCLDFIKFKVDFLTDIETIYNEACLTLNKKYNIFQFDEYSFRITEEIYDNERFLFVQCYDKSSINLTEVSKNTLSSNRVSKSVKTFISEISDKFII